MICSTIFLIICIIIVLISVICVFIENDLTFFLFCIFIVPFFPATILNPVNSITYETPYTVIVHPSRIVVIAEKKEYSSNNFEECMHWQKEGKGYLTKKYNIYGVEIENKFEK